MKHGILRLTPIVLGFVLGSNLGAGVAHAQASKPRRTTARDGIPH